MSTTVPTGGIAPVPENYLNMSHTLRSWLLTDDHKRVGWLYMISITFFFFVGGSAATLIRLELITPAGDMVSADTYNRLFTLHGIVMVWFFLIPSIPTTMGNFFIPLMIGAKDVAFPKINLLSWYIFNAAGLLVIATIVFGGVDTGWTFYTPYSTGYAHGAVLLAAGAVALVGFSSILSGLNFIVTIHQMRAPGMTWFRLPLFVWSSYATSLLNVVATPVITITLLMVILQRAIGVGFFDPSQGGDPILFQHMFWFYSHPAVYIMILPGMGVTSELITAFARKRVFSYGVMALATMAIAIMSFQVWGHHMFVAGQSTYGSLVFSLLSYLVSIPSAIKTFNWTATLYKGDIHFDAPMLYALSFVVLFAIGGMTGLFLAALGADVSLHATYFVIAHFHYIMVGGMVTAYLGGLHYWWPKITGRMYPEMWARFAALILFVGFNLTFLPQFILGYGGMPRRYYSYDPAFQFLNVMSSAGASILAIGYILPLFYLTWSLRYGRRAGPNPWGATGLEWQTSSPPPEDNFETIPRVTKGPYSYE